MKSPARQTKCAYCGEPTTLGFMYAYSNGAPRPVCCRTCAVDIEREDSLRTILKPEVESEKEWLLTLKKTLKKYGNTPHTML